MNRQHAHRVDDLSRLPRPTADDWRALLWLIAVVLIVLALCAVDPAQLEAAR